MYQHENSTVTLQPFKHSKRSTLQACKQSSIIENIRYIVRVSLGVNQPTNPFLNTEGGIYRENIYKISTTANLIADLEIWML